MPTFGHSRVLLTLFFLTFILQIFMALAFWTRNDTANMQIAISWAILVFLMMAHSDIKEEMKKLQDEKKS